MLLETGVSEGQNLLALSSLPKRPSKRNCRNPLDMAFRAGHSIGQPVQLRIRMDCRRRPELAFSSIISLKEDPDQ